MSDLIQLSSAVKTEILDFVFPVYLNCGLCQTDLWEASHFCSRCLAESLAYIEDTCSVCGRPLDLPKVHYRDYGGRCKVCQEHFYFFRAHKAFTLYEGRAKQMLLGIKYKGQQQYVPIIGEGLYHAVKQSSFYNSFDWIVPVPIHFSRKWLRGFNQAEAYALNLQSYFPEIPVKNVLKRHKFTKKLKNLDKETRNKMLQNAIMVKMTSKDMVKGQRILLVDDIYTTGTTLSACAKVLYEAGALEIYAVSFAMGK